MAAPKVGIFKRMMMEIPHVPITTAHFLFGAALGIYYVTCVYERGIGYQPYYTVMRSDDPRVARLKKFPMEPQ